MSVKQILTWAQQQLAHFCNPRLEAEVLLSELLQKDRSQLKVLEDLKLSFVQVFRYKRWVFKRAKNIPVAYILGYKEFMGKRFTVNKHTLIPRDETEILIDHILKQKRKFEVKSLLDVGTGSGVIALSIGFGIGSLGQITALDISRKALKVARENAKKHKVDIDFQYSNMLSSIEKGSSFDIIVANLPYVPEDLKVEKDLAYEPSTAIFSGTDGLIHIKRLRDELKAKEIDFKELWLEFLPQQAKEIKKIFEDLGKVELKKDLSGQIFFACVENLFGEGRQ